jgi:hypothetical protein
MYFCKCLSAQVHNRIFQNPKQSCLKFSGRRKFVTQRGLGVIQFFLSAADSNEPRAHDHPNRNTNMQIKGHAHGYITIMGA